MRTQFQRASGSVNDVQKSKLNRTPTRRDSKQRKAPHRPAPKLTRLHKHSTRITLIITILILIINQHHQLKHHHPHKTRKKRNPVEILSFHHLRKYLPPRRAPLLLRHWMTTASLCRWRHSSAPRHISTPKSLLFPKHWRYPFSFLEHPNTHHPRLTPTAAKAATRHESLLKPTTYTIITPSRQKMAASSTHLPSTRQI